MAKEKRQISRPQVGLTSGTVLFLLMINHAIVANHTEQLKDPNNLITYLLGVFVVIYIAIVIIDYSFKRLSK